MANVKITLISGDLSREVKNLVKPRALKIPKLQFTATLEMEKSLHEQLDTDARFTANLYDDLTKLYKELQREVAEHYKKYDDLAVIIPLTDKEKKLLDQAVNAVLNVYEKKLDACVEEHIKKWKQARKDTRKYYLSVTKNISGGAVMVAVSAPTLISGTVTGGLGTALAIYNIAYSVLNIGKEIKRLFTGIDPLQQKLSKTMQALLVTYRNDSAVQIGLKESVKSALNSFLGKQITSVKSLEKDLLTFKGKKGELEKQASKLGKELNQLLDKQAELDKLISQKLEKMLRQRKLTSRKLPVLQEKLDKNLRGVRDLLKKLEELNKGLKQYDKFMESASKALNELKRGVPTWSKALDAAVSMGALLSTATVNGIVSGGESLVESAQTTRELWEGMKDAA